jgi:hypothetical protein
MSVPSGEQKSISMLDLYHLFRSRVEHEDNLIVQRLSWLVASQSFLFTAYAIVTNGLNSPSATSNAFARQELRLVHIIPLVAVLNSLLIYVGILAALRKLYLARAGGSGTMPLRMEVENPF